MKSENCNLDSMEYDFDKSEPYSTFVCQQEILHDSSLTYFITAIKNNDNIFRNKIILDIGCGTGILSAFALNHGAKMVIGVEPNNKSCLLNYTRKILETNCKNVEGRLYLINDEIKNITLPNNLVNVDVIISQWMGHSLFFQSLFLDVILARKKWLHSDGIILPDRACLYISSLQNLDYKKNQIDHWENVYGLDMSCIKQGALLEPVIDSVDNLQTVTNAMLLMEFDLYTAELLDIDFSSKFTLTAHKNDFINAFYIFFTIEFTRCHKSIGFSTNPEVGINTRFKQTIFYIDEPIVIKNKEFVYGHFHMKLDKKKHILYKITYNFNGEIQTVKENYNYILR